MDLNEPQGNGTARKLQWWIMGILAALVGALSLLGMDNIVSRVSALESEVPKVEVLNQRVSDIKQDVLEIRTLERDSAVELRQLHDLMLTNSQGKK